MKPEESSFDDWLVTTIAVVGGAASLGGCIGSLFGDGYVIPYAAISASMMLLSRLTRRTKR